jgi:hypothetical protein
MAPAGCTRMVSRMPSAIWGGQAMRPRGKPLAVVIVTLGHLRDNLFAYDLNSAENVLLSLHDEPYQHMGSA